MNGLFDSTIPEPARFLSGFLPSAGLTIMNSMIESGELLRRYAKGNDEEAFAELVNRHLKLVYSAALRQVDGVAHLAEDIAQTVFMDLAREACTLSDQVV